MSAVAAAAGMPPLRWDDAPSPGEINELAATFLQHEARAAEAYRVAIELDEVSEIFKERLLLVTEQFGETMNCQWLRAKVLTGTSFEVIATFQETKVIDQGAVDRLALAVTRSSDAAVLMPQLFKIQWNLLPSAAEATEIVKSAKFGAAMTDLLRSCFVKGAVYPSLSIRSPFSRARSSGVIGM